MSNARDVFANIQTVSRYRNRKLRGYAAPALRGRPLFIRLCEAFVENLGRILKVGLVVGGIVLVRDLDVLLESVRTAETDAPVAEIASGTEAAPVEETKDEESALTPGVQHALNCTYTEYRNEHYDECVDEPSDIYKRPEAGPNDIGFVDYDDVILYAGLNPDPATSE